MAALSLFGCVSKQTPVVQITRTLGTDSRLPQHEIQEFLSQSDWRGLRDLEYERYVVMGADIRPDGSVSIGKVKESYPDGSWNQIARSFGEEVVLRVTGSTDSMLRMRGEICVVFFKPEPRGKLVLVFGQQIDARDIQPREGSTMFRGQQLSMTPLEISHRPKYIRTFIY